MLLSCVVGVPGYLAHNKTPNPSGQAGRPVDKRRVEILTGFASLASVERVRAISQVSSEKGPDLDGHEWRDIGSGSD